MPVYVHHIPSALALFSSALSWFPAAVADVPTFNNSNEYSRGNYGNYPRQRYLSNPEIIAPVANVYTVSESSLSPSKYVAWAPYGPNVPRSTPMLLDANTGSMVWSGPQHAGLTIGTNVQRCNGTDYMTWWQGRQVHDRPYGSHYLYNSKYEMVYNVSTVGSLEAADSHELFLTSKCTAIISAYQTRPYPLPHLNMTHLKDSYFQEIDLASGNLIYEWQASRFVDIHETYWTGTVPADGQWKKDGLEFIAQGKKMTDGFDFFHINSIEKDKRGNYLVSSRHTCTVYYISGATGEVLWRLGGKRSDFTDLSDGKASDFAWQHHARWVDEELTSISIYDNRNSGYQSSTDPVSRGIIVKLDHVRKTVSLEKVYTASHGVRSFREGSMQLLRDLPVSNNVLLGYGHEPAWTEFDSNGTILLDVALGPFGRNRATADNYHTFKVNWTGMPNDRPSIASGPAFDYAFDKEHKTFHIRLDDDSGKRLANDTLYFSWNGATETKSWVVLVRNASTPSFDMGRDFHSEIAKTTASFESHAFVGADAGYAAAMAVDGSDAILGLTPIVHVRSGVTIAVHCDLERLTAEWRAYRQGSDTPVVGGGDGVLGAAPDVSGEETEEGVGAAGRTATSLSGAEMEGTVGSSGGLRVMLVMALMVVGSAIGFISWRGWCTGESRRRRGRELGVYGRDEIRLVGSGYEDGEDSALWEEEDSEASEWDGDGDGFGEEQGQASLLSRTKKVES